MQPIKYLTTCNSPRIALILILIIFIISGCKQNQSTQASSHNKSSAASDISSNIQKKIEPFPMLNISNCSELDALTRNTKLPNINDKDMQVVNEILSDTNNNHSITIFKFMPNQVMWFARMNGPISIQTLGTAIHESNHIIDLVLTHCNNGIATYYIDGQIIKTNHKPGDTPSYSIAADILLKTIKNNDHRYKTYFKTKELNALNDKADFSILLDELIAYTYAASLDISILRMQEYSWLVDSGIRWLDINPGGMTDFMLYTLAYIKSLRINYPESYQRLAQQPQTLALLQMVWTTAEKNLISAYDLTTSPSSDGKLFISHDVIFNTYSDKFIKELDALGIAHMPKNEWTSTYLSNIIMIDD